MLYISGMDRISLLIAAVAATLVTGCGADSTAPRSALAGTYTLFAVDEIRLPATATIDGVMRTVTRGTLTVNDTAYHYTVCMNATGATDAACGTGQTALVDSGRVVHGEGGASFIGWTTHASRALVVSGDTLRFQRNDNVAPRFDFVR
jgi:hypothetical protein